MIGGKVTVNNINKKFGDFQVLDNINLQINPGEFFSLLGPSGCGKTTLLRIIAGFETPTTGELLLDGYDLIKVHPNKRPVNTIFQNYALFPHLTVYENVAFPLRLRKIDGKKIKESTIQDKVEEYLGLVKLTEHQKKYPAQMSGGQRQRVAIARALINNPRVLLLDEPLSALDAKLRHQLLIDLDAIHDKVGITFIYVTHDQQEALSVSDRIAVMKDGVVLQVGTPSEIYEFPADMFVANFIGETNILEGKITEVDMENSVATMNEKTLNELTICPEKDIKVDDVIKIAIRPEKIRISKTHPEKIKNVNILKGFVDEVIYTGFQSRYYVKVDNILFKVIKQHIKYYMDEVPINWKDEVYIWWYVDDEYIVEIE